MSHQSKHLWLLQCERKQDNVLWNQIVKEYAGYFFFDCYLYSTTNATQKPWAGKRKLSVLWQYERQRQTHHHHHHRTVSLLCGELTWRSCPYLQFVSGCVWPRSPPTHTGPPLGLPASSSPRATWFPYSSQLWGTKGNTTQQRYCFVLWMRSMYRYNCVVTLPQKRPPS